jgi:hypothetical protein
VIAPLHLRSPPSTCGRSPASTIFFHHLQSPPSTCDRSHPPADRLLLLPGRCIYHLFSSPAIALFCDRVSPPAIIRLPTCESCDLSPPPAIAFLCLPRVLCLPSPLHLQVLSFHFRLYLLLSACDRCPSPDAFAPLHLQSESLRGSTQIAGPR